MAKGQAAVMSSASGVPGKSQEGPPPATPARALTSHAPVDCVHAVVVEEVCAGCLQERQSQGWPEPPGSTRPSQDMGQGGAGAWGYLSSPHLESRELSLLPASGAYF